MFRVSAKIGVELREQSKRIHRATRLVLVQQDIRFLALGVDIKDCGEPLKRVAARAGQQLRKRTLVVRRK